MRALKWAAGIALGMDPEEPAGSHGGVKRASSIDTSISSSGQVHHKGEREAEVGFAGVTERVVDPDGAVHPAVLCGGVVYKLLPVFFVSYPTTCVWMRRLHLQSNHRDLHFSNCSLLMPHTLSPRRLCAAHT